MKHQKKTKTLLTGEATLTKEDIYYAVERGLGEDYGRLRNTTNLKEFILELESILPTWRKIETRAKWDFPALEALYGAMLSIVRRCIIRQKRTSAIELPPLPSNYDEIEDWLATVKIRLKALRTHINYFDETTKRVVWDDVLNYITLKDAADKSGGLFTIKSLSKHLRRKSNTIRWMNLNKRSKVHKEDFNSHIKTLKKISKHRERISSHKGTCRANIQ